jgi:hypothetical protein
MPMPPLDPALKEKYLKGAENFISRRAHAAAEGIALATMESRQQSLGIAKECAQIYARNRLGTGVIHPIEVAQTSRADKRPDGDPDEQRITRDSGEKGDTLEATGTRIRTLEDLLSAANVDLDIWYVERHVVNKWENFSVKFGLTELFQVKAWLKRKAGAVGLIELRDAAVELMREHSPAPVRRYKVAPRTGLCMDVLIPDLHLGKLAHAEETGQNYDGAIAMNLFRGVFYGLLTHGQTMSVGRFVFPVGNDLLHVEGSENETTAGTRQDTDSRSYRSRKRALKLMVEAVDAMAQIAPVDIVIVPGNHAREAEAALGDVLSAWYRRDTDRVRIHDTPAPRKYLTHGKNLFGYTHGDGVAAKDLPLLMATEAPKMWARTEHRFWNTGHLHQRKSDRFGSIQEHKGVEVRISPSLAAADSWHASKGFVGNLRAAEAHVYHEEDGEIARFRAVLPKREKAA